MQIIHFYILYKIFLIDYDLFSISSKNFNNTCHFKFTFIIFFTSIYLKKSNISILSTYLNIVEITNAIDANVLAIDNHVPVAIFSRSGFAGTTI